MTQQELAAKKILQAAPTAQVLDLVDRRFSYGPRTNTQNMVNEHATQLQLTWKITNNTAADKLICISTLFDDADKNPTFLANVARVLAITESNAVFKTGKIVDGADDADVTVSSSKASRIIEEFLRYAGENPLRFVKWSMKSKNIADNSKDSSNYDNTIRSIWVTPFDVPQIDELDMRSLQIGGNNFNPDMLDVHFIANDFRAVLSNEHFLQFQVNKGTELTITAFIGAQDAKAQRFWRDVKKSDAAIRPALLK